MTLHSEDSSGITESSANAVAMLEKKSMYKDKAYLVFRLSFVSFAVLDRFLMRTFLLTRALSL
jgi:hypothetical protein